MSTRNNAFQKNRLYKEFLNGNEGEFLLREYLKEKTEENLNKLDEAFKIHYLKVRAISYFTKIFEFEAKHYDKKTNLLSNRFSAILDAPIPGQMELTLKDSIQDRNNTNNINVSSLEEMIENERVSTAVRKLTERQREAIHSYFFQGMKEIEIAMSWGTSKQSVSKAKRTALKKLKGELAVG